MYSIGGVIEIDSDDEVSPEQLPDGNSESDIGEFYGFELKSHLEKCTIEKITEFANKTKHIKC